MYRIIDLDNCISDDAWRIPYIDWQHLQPMRRYHNYHSLAPFDKFENKHLFATNDRIIIFTARPVMYRCATVEWLRRNGIVYSYLLMRNNSDHKHSLDLKREHLSWLPELYGVPLSMIQLAVDDHQEIVDMYRAKGLRAERVAIHDLPYQPPAKEARHAESC